MKIQDTFKEFFTLQQEIRKVRVDQKHKEVLKHPREKEYLDKKTLGYDSRYEENLRGKNIRQAGHPFQPSAKLFTCSSCAKNFDQKDELDLHLEYFRQTSRE